LRKLSKRWASTLPNVGILDILKSWRSGPVESSPPAERRLELKGREIQSRVKVIITFRCSDSRHFSQKWCFTWKTI
jgi:hypothetical protein